MKIYYHKFFKFVVLFLVFSFSAFANKNCEKFLNGMLSSIQTSSPSTSKFELTNSVPVTICGNESNNSCQLNMKEGRFLLSDLPQYNPESIYIGVANSTNDGNHHYYLIAGNKRYDALPFYSRAKIKTNLKGIPLASKGVIFELKVDKETVDRLQANMVANRNLTCLHGLCKILKATGIEITTPSSNIRTRTIAVGLLSGQIKNQNGNLIDANLYATSLNELEHFIKRANIADAEMKQYVEQNVSRIFLLIGTIGSLYALPTLANDESGFFMISQQISEK